jgi:hypothetical protein
MILSRYVLAAEIAKPGGSGPPTTARWPAMRSSSLPVGGDHPLPGRLLTSGRETMGKVCGVLVVMLPKTPMAHETAALLSRCLAPQESRLKWASKPQGSKI